MSPNQKFPSNQQALDQLRRSTQISELIPFVGSGASVPLFPSWRKLFEELLQETAARGLLSDDRDLAFLRGQIRSDPASAASALEMLNGKDQFRDLVAEKFSARREGTPVHKALINLRFDTIITTNYDSGLEACATNAQVHWSSIRNTDKPKLTKWMQSDLGGETLNILHWHGTADDPPNMIVTAGDYVSFYGQSDNREFVSNLWRQRRLLVVGFGLSDPPLVNICELALRQLPTADRHFAFIGVHPDEEISPLAIKQFSDKFRLQPIFYEIDADGGGHSALLELLRDLATHRPQQRSASTIPEQPSSSGTLTAAPPLGDGSTEFQSGLLVFNGRQLYVEPQLAAIKIHEAPDPNTTEHRTNAEISETPISVAEILARDEHVIIFARSEAGSTTLGKRFATELIARGEPTGFRDANRLHPYKAKLQQELPESKIENRSTLILDSFNPDRHERLLKEIMGLGRFARVILFINSDAARAVDAARGLFPDAKLLAVRYNNLTRSDVRALASTMLETSDSDLVSQVVERAYEDLLNLCIPLTPANVIMYLSVIVKDGDFSPLNRVQIIEKYLSDLLKKPDDAFKEAFNTRNRLDVISAFVHSCFEGGLTEVTESDWYNFSKIYKENELVDYDERALLTDLLNSRVLISSSQDGSLSFKYRFFYLYFLGRHIATHRDELFKMMSEDKHIAINGLVEVITSVGVEGEAVAADLSKKLRAALDEIWSQYRLKDKDPFVRVQWPKSDDEKEKLWDPIFEELAAGPYATSQVDELKRSIQAERKTENQKVAILQFDKLETKVFSYSGALASCLVSCDSLSGSTKLSVAELLLESAFLSYMIGLLYAPLIARSRIFYWNGMVYHNLLQDEPHYGNDIKRQTFLVASEMGSAVVRSLSENIGSKKLGEVFKGLWRNKTREGFEVLALFSLLIRTKPREWATVAEGMISNIDRKAYYLRTLLFKANQQFHVEINTNQERSALKRLIALVRVRRDLKVNAPGEKAIKSGLRQLEEGGYFQEPASSEGQASTAPESSK
jgi:hypothetical protein